MALTLYHLPFDHRPWSVFADSDRLRALNPLMRVPALVLRDGVVLTDSHMILDHLDTLVAEPMFPRDEPARHRALQVAALATGLAEKAVSLFYERRLHAVTSPVWETRLQTQITSVLAALEGDRAARDSLWWFGDRFGHADIAVACALRFVAEAHPAMIGTAHPRLARHAAAMEALPVFRQISQAFAAPA